MGRDWILISEGIAIGVDTSDRVQLVASKPDAGSDAEDNLVLRLLIGLHEDKDGRAITSFLDPDSPEGKKACRALAQQLREGSLSYLVRDQLALALDPETPSPIPGNKPI